MRGSKISVIIPHLRLPGTEDALRSCLESIKITKSELELIIVLDKIGYGKAVNEGMKQATGDYLFVINNDTEVISGTLEMMLDPEYITVPVISPTARDDNPRCFFCVPRELYEKVKSFKSNDFYDERFFPGYFEDDDLIQRLKLLNIETKLIGNVLIHHKNGGGLTMKQLGEQESYDINKERYKEKWGLTGFNI